MLPGILATTTGVGKTLAFVFDNDLQTGILITLGVLLLLVGTLLRHRFSVTEETRNAQPSGLWAKPAQSTSYAASAAGVSESTGFSFSRSIDRDGERRPIGHLAIHSAPTTERRANLV